MSASAVFRGIFVVTVVSAGVALGGEPGSGDSWAMSIGAPAPVAFGGQPGRPVLYDNTDVCTPNVHWLALSGQTPDPVLLRDWFTAAGGNVRGFDLYVVNGGSTDQQGNPVDQRFELRFYDGTDALHLGIAIPEAIFRNTGAPLLSRIPAWVDPVTGEPGIIRITVDYDAQTYNLVGLYEDPPGSGHVVEQQLSSKDEPIGKTYGRLPFTLPASKVGAGLRFIGQNSICDSSPEYPPRTGPVLAGGGSGNEDGLHIIANYGPSGSQCSPDEYPLLCDDPGWIPFESVPCQDDSDCEAVLGPGVPCLVDGTCAQLVPVACMGGDVCDLDLPHYGIALTLYIGPDEDKDGNNEVATADEIPLDPPAPCTSGLVTVDGFIGNNGQPIGSGPVRFFDCDKDGVVEFSDFACFQRCFGVEPSAACRIHDYDSDADIDLFDYAGLLICTDDPSDPQCTGELPPIVDPLRDVDLYVVTGLTSGHVLSALVEGETNSHGTALWNPYVRLFADSGSGVEELVHCDDYYRFSRDALMTVEVSAGASAVYIGVSSAANAQYEPDDPMSIFPVGEDDAGGYVLSVAVTDPQCVLDDQSGGAFQCYVSKHEPDDTLADATTLGPISNTILVGAIGDGAFSGLGQDIDIYRIELDGAPLSGTAEVLAITATVKDIAGQGFQTVFDLAMGLYDSAGFLIATADQSSMGGSLDQSHPVLGANVCGAGIVDCPKNASPDPGVYYLAIFGTDRVAFDENGDPLPVAIPPSVLNFPHADGAGCTEDCDLRPIVGGRVNRPGPPLVGREPPAPNLPPNGPTLQCYRIVVSTCPSGSPFCTGTPLPTTGPDDPDELAGPNGNDSIGEASWSVGVGDRLANAPAEVRVLGNGHYGGFQGDVDFYAVAVEPGQLVSLNVAQHDPSPPGTDGFIRSYVALYGADGCPLVTEDYSLEHYDDNIFVIGNIVQELAATVVGIVPSDGTGIVYPMVGIDAGNLDPTENLPFDPHTPGTTLSRRFQAQIQSLPRYDIAIAVMDPVWPVADGRRMFVAAHRGIDDLHSEPFVSTPAESICERFLPILELDPWTGRTVAVLDGGSFFSTCRPPMGICTNPDGCEQAVSANPLVAYDGETLFVTVERCVPGPLPCPALIHPLFRIDPDLEPGQTGFILPAGDIDGLPMGAELTGMIELGDYLFALDDSSNRVRFWAKDIAPAIGNGGLSADLTLLSGTDPNGTEFDDVSGDVGTDGTLVYVGCSLTESAVGVCVFDFQVPPGATELNVTFLGVVQDPVTNEALLAGPRLGGLDFAAEGVMVASDRNGPIVEHWHIAGDHVRALELPREIIVDRLTVR